MRSCAERSEDPVSGINPRQESSFSADSSLDEKLLDEYIAKNTVNGMIVLYRRYYGLSAKKP